MNSSVKTGKWVGDCFIYTTASNRLCYFVGAESYSISPFDMQVSICTAFLFLTASFSPLYLLGYIPAHNRVYLVDKDMNLYGYSLSLTVVEYQTAVLRGETESAAEILASIPKDQLNKVARFLEGRGLSPFTNTFSMLIMLSELFRPQRTRYSSDDRP